MKWVLIIIGVVVLLVAAAGFGLYKIYTFGEDELVPIADQALRDMDAGNHQAVYDGAAKALRDATPLTELVATMDQRKAVLGAYQEIAEVEGVNINVSDDKGSVAALTVRLRYEKAETDGVFHFVKEDDVWKLSGFDLEAPDDATKPKPEDPPVEGE